MADLGPYELALTLRGARERARDQLRQTAWLVATMINVMSTSKVTVGELLGEEAGAPASIAEAEAQAAAARETAEAKAGAGWADDVDADGVFASDDG